jgi:hypothetical protein
LTAKSGLLAHMGHIARVPSVWMEAVRVSFGIRRRRRLWVSSSYLQWRNHTAYGTDNVGASESDLVHYLRWRKQMRRLAKWETAA